MCSKVVKTAKYSSYGAKIETSLLGTSIKWENIEDELISSSTTSDFPETVKKLWKI